MLKSIKAQLFFVLIVLATLLLVEVTLFRATFNTFKDDQALVQTTVSKVQIVGQLERELLDLQRNVLIYKETGAKSVLSRVDSLIHSINLKIGQFAGLSDNDEKLNEIESYLSSLRGHLQTYEENFKEVVKGRLKQAEVYQQNIVQPLSELSIKIAEYKQLSSSIQIAVLNTKLAISQYLSSPGFSQIQSVKMYLNKALEEIEVSSLPSELKTSLTASINKVKVSFNQLSQITRGYVFLVNVVMSGSANEFLYITKVLSERVNQTVEKNKSKSQEDLNTFTDYTNVFLSATVLATLLTAIFFIKRVINPIEQITGVFKKLSDGATVDSIPSLEKRDEIGQLAKAAKIFSDKNQQTIKLLKQSELQNIQQTEMNQELLAEKQKAEHATKSKSMFLANMSHEIRTPMNGIIGFVDLLKLTSLNKTQQSYLDRIKYSSNIMMSVINDILDFSKIEAGKLSIEEIDFSLNDVLDSLILSLSAKAVEKNLSLRAYFDPNIPSILRGDPNRIGQVMLNICNNALKFTEQGYINIYVFYRQENEVLTIRIEDTGVGMTDEQKASVFESFTQADGSTSRKYGGTGLGLSIVRNLVELMSGTVECDSFLNVGTTFKVTLPLKTVDTKPLVAEQAKASKGQLIYVSEQKVPLLQSMYLAPLNLPYKTVLQERLVEFLHQTNLNDPIRILLEVKQHSNKMQLHKLLQNLKVEFESQFDRNIISFAFVGDTTEYSTTKELSEKYEAPMITQPVTPFLLSKFHKEVIVQAVETGATNGSGSAKPKLLSGHVLLVEDNKINQMVTSKMLKLHGLTFDIAENGVEAVQMVEDSEYDLILMDMQMPVMDGYTATKEIRAHGYTDVLICGLSANAMKQDFDLAYEAGVDHYLTKPLTVDVFKDFLENQYKLRHTLKRNH